MGRWDYDLYDSDGTLDYRATIMMRLEREIDYWLSLENVANDNSWLAQILTSIELILLFEKRETRGIYFNSEKTIQRWQDIFLTVWDNNWNNENGHYPYAKFDYRQTHRSAIVKMLDRLKVLARNFENSYDPYVEPTPLLVEYKLPYFSVKRWINSNGIKVVSAERFVHDLLVALQKDIEYWLSSDRHARVIKWDMPYSNEEVLAAVDTLALLSDAYERSPLVDLQTVQRWKIATIELDKEFSSDNDPISEEKYLKLINETFDKLETVARKYPPDEWW